VSEKQHAPEPSTLPPPSQEVLVQLHLAEFNALTTRNNNWVAIQVGIWTLILLYITVASTVWAFNWQAKGDFEPYIIWASGLIIQLALLILYFTIQEVYRNVYYIEHELRELIQPLAGNNAFWQYERFLAIDTKRKPAWTDASATVGFLGAFVAATLIRYPWHSAFDKREVIGFIVNLLLAGCLIWQTKLTIDLRRRFQFPSITSG